MIEEILDFVVLKEGNLFADDVRKLNKGGVERFDLAFGEVFEKTAEGDEMICLGDSFEIFAIAVFFAVELEAEFAEELLGDVGGLEVFTFARNFSGDE